MNVHATAAVRAEKVFVDIGAHDGGSIAEVLAGNYSFDRMISAEPDPDMVAHLSKRFAEEIRDARYEVAPVGISNRIGTARLFGDNAGGSASLLPSKFALNNRASKVITLVDWPKFIADHKLQNARLWVKINAEGAEIDIIQSILAHDAGQIESVVIYFDIVKTPFGAWSKWKALRDLRQSNVPFHTAESILVKHGPRPRLHNWLSSFPNLKSPAIPPEKAPMSKLIRMHYLDLVSAIGIRLDVFKRKKKSA